MVCNPIRVFRYAAGFNSATVVHWQRSYSGRLHGRGVIHEPVTLNYVRDVSGRNVAFLPRVVCR